MYIANMKYEKKKVILNIFLTAQNVKENYSEITFWR